MEKRKIVKKTTKNKPILFSLKRFIIKKMEYLKHLQINKKEEEYNNLMNVNDENKNTFDTLLLKHNNLLEKYNNLNKENGQIKNEILDLRKVNDKLLKNMDEIEYQRKSK